METSKCPKCGKSLVWVRSHATAVLLCLEADAAGNTAIIDGMAHTFRGDLFEGCMPLAAKRYSRHQCVWVKE